MRDAGCVLTLFALAAIVVLAIIQGFATGVRERRHFA